MALLFVDGFDHYSTQAQGQRKWNANPGTATGSARYGRGSYAQFGSFTMQKVLSVNATTLICGFALQQTSNLGTGGSTIVAFRDGSTVQVLLSLDTNLNFAVYRSSTANLLGTASGANSGMKIGTWYYVELKVKIDPAAGTVDLHINGTSVLSLTGQNTRASANSFANQVVCTGASGTSNNLYDDFYICDTTGTTNNDFLGEIEVRTVYPTGDNAVQFTSSSGGGNFTNVDDSPVNDDTDYNESSTVGQKDLFGLTTMSPAPTSVLSVAVTTTWRKTDTTARSLRNILKSSATTSNGTTLALSASYTLQQDIYDFDPNGSIAWTVSAANAMLPGYELVS